MLKVETAYELCLRISADAAYYDQAVAKSGVGGHCVHHGVRAVKCMRCDLVVLNAVCQGNARYVFNAHITMSGFE